jgi:hypothetical protein
MSCNSLNVQAPTLKPNPQTLVHVPYNTHCQTLTKLQSEKTCSKLANCKKKFVNLFTKTPISEQPNQHHTHGFVFGPSKHAQLFILKPFAHTTIPKGTQFYKKAFWNYPLQQSYKSPFEQQRPKFQTVESFAKHW